MAARKAPLRSVGKDEAPPPPAKPKTLLEAVDSGDYLAELKATHQRIARTVNNPETSPRDLAALTRRQLEISKEIRAIALAIEEEAGGSGEPTPDESFDASAI